MTVEDIPTPVVTITQPATPPVHGQPLTLTAVVTAYSGSLSYQWVVNSTYMAGATNSTFTSSTLADNDVVACVVSATNSCGTGIVSGSAAVAVNTTGVGQLGITGSISVVPNPNKGVFSLTGSLPQQPDGTVAIIVTDMLGQLVYQGSGLVENGNINEQVILDGRLANGMYLLNVKTASGDNVFHFVIEK
jgi:hypothetical protein